MRIKFSYLDQFVSHERGYVNCLLEAFVCSSTVTLPKESESLCTLLLSASLDKNKRMLLVSVAGERCVQLTPSVCLLDLVCWVEVHHQKQELVLCCCVAAS